jgi:hypothetical protein
MHVPHAAATEAALQHVLVPFLLRLAAREVAPPQPTAPVPLRVRRRGQAF